MADSLIEALTYRRSRRFAPGMKLPGGPLRYESRQPVQPLSIDEEATLAFAACGITGSVTADLPYDAGGNIMKQFVGRTAPSADALHTVTVFVINDDGAWMLKRPQDFTPGEIGSLVDAARNRRFTELYQRSRVRIAEKRADVPRVLPFVPPFNHWSANVPGTTYFLPVIELTSMYINILLSAFSDDFRYFVLDDRHGFRPAGVGRFGRSKGGPLADDLREGKFLTVTSLESWLMELAAVELGAIVQNLGLMAQSLGLGGFPHFAAHPFGWPEALGFRMQQLTFSRVSGVGWLTKTALRLLKKDLSFPMGTGLESHGEVLIEPYCPPYYASMTEAVRHFVDAKFAAKTGTFRSENHATPWRSAREVLSGIPTYSGSAVEAATAYCEYVWKRYGRFPAACGPFRTVVAYQAHHLDQEFYEKFYSGSQR